MSEPGLVVVLVAFERTTELRKIIGYLRYQSIIYIYFKVYLLIYKRHVEILKYTDTCHGCEQSL